MKKALFIDRDGTIIEHRPYLSDPDQVVLVPGVKQLLLAARQRGYKLFLFTNQSGVGRGYYPMETVLKVNARMEELLGPPHPFFDDICIAPESPDDPQVYRKPSPKFILETVKKHDLDPAECYMVGDARSDVLAGLNAGINTVAVRSNGPHKADEFPEIISGKVPLYGNITEFLTRLLAV